MNSETVVVESSSAQAFSWTWNGAANDDDDGRCIKVATGLSADSLYTSTVPDQLFSESSSMDDCTFPATVASDPYEDVPSYPQLPDNVFIGNDTNLFSVAANIEIDDESPTSSRWKNCESACLHYLDLSTNPYEPMFEDSFMDSIGSVAGDFAAVADPAEMNVDESDGYVLNGCGELMGVDAVMLTLDENGLELMDRPRKVPSADGRKPKRKRQLSTTWTCTVCQRSSTYRKVIQKHLLREHGVENDSDYCVASPVANGNRAPRPPRAIKTDDWCTNMNFGDEMNSYICDGIDMSHIGNEFETSNFGNDTEMSHVNDQNSRDSAGLSSTHSDDEPVQGDNDQNLKHDESIIHGVKVILTPLEKLLKHLTYLKNQKQLKSLLCEMKSSSPFKVKLTNTNETNDDPMDLDADSPALQDVPPDDVLSGDVTDTTPVGDNVEQTLNQINQSCNFCDSIENTCSHQKSDNDKTDLADAQESISCRPTNNVDELESQPRVPQTPVAVEQVPEGDDAMDDVILQEKSLVGNDSDTTLEQTPENDANEESEFARIIRNQPCVRLERLRLSPSLGCSEKYCVHEHRLQWLPDSRTIANITASLSNPILIHECDICCYRFASKYRLKQHRAIHVETTTVCDDCTRPFDKRSFRHHLGNYTGPMHRKKAIEEYLSKVEDFEKIALPLLPRRRSEELALVNCKERDNDSNVVKRSLALANVKPWNLFTALNNCEIRLTRLNIEMLKMYKQSLNGCNGVVLGGRNGFDFKSLAGSPRSKKRRKKHNKCYEVVHFQLSSSSSKRLRPNYGTAKGQTTALVKIQEKLDDTSNDCTNETGRPKRLCYEPGYYRQMVQGSDEVEELEMSDPTPTMNVDCPVTEDCVDAIPNELSQFVGNVPSKHRSLFAFAERLRQDSESFFDDDNDFETPKRFKYVSYSVQNSGSANWFSSVTYEQETLGDRCKMLDVTSTDGLNRPTDQTIDIKQPSLASATTVSTSTVTVGTSLVKRSRGRPRNVPVDVIMKENQIPSLQTAGVSKRPVLTRRRNSDSPSPKYTFRSSTNLLISNAVDPTETVRSFEVSGIATLSNLGDMAAQTVKSSQPHLSENETAAVENLPVRKRCGRSLKRPVVAFMKENQIPLSGQVIETKPSNEAPSSSLERTRASACKKMTHANECSTVPMSDSELNPTLNKILPTDEPNALERARRSLDANKSNRSLTGSANCKPIQQVTICSSITHTRIEEIGKCDNKPSKSGSCKRFTIDRRKFHKNGTSLPPSGKSPPESSDRSQPSTIETDRNAKSKRLAISTPACDSVESTKVTIATDASQTDTPNSTPAKRSRSSVACRFCQVQIASYDKLRNHVSKTHSTVDVPCMFCDQLQPLSRRDLENHLTRHFADESRKRVGLAASLVQFLLREGRAPSTKEYGTYCCTKCTKVFASQRSIDKHKLSCMQ